MNANFQVVAAAAGSRHRLGSQIRMGYIAKALEEVKIHGKRFIAYLATGGEAPDADKSHHFYFTKRALEEEREIPVIVKVNFLAERMGHGTDVIPDIEEVVDIFKGGLFDPKNFFNPVYRNSKGATIGSCLRAANPETSILAGLKGFEYGARVTQRPAPIFFVTVLKMIDNAGGKIHFY